MFRLIMKILFIILIVILLHSGLLILFPSDQSHYLAAILDKQDALVNHQSGSILIAGGSSAAFGFDSRYMEIETGLPVLNMGLHGGLGLRYYLNSIRPYVENDDVVILSIEHTHYFTSPDFQSSNVLRILLGMDYFGQLPHISSLGQWLTIIRYHHEYTLNIMRSNIMNTDNECPGITYCRDSFNLYGDIRPEFMTSTDESRQKLLNNISIQDDFLNDVQINDEAISLLNNFASEMQDQNVRVFIVLPPIPDSLMTQSSAEIFGQQLRDVLTIDILSEQASYPQSLFYDTIYHLNNEGRSQYMDFIAPIIHNAVSSR